MEERPRRNRENLRNIAMAQKGILFSILAQFLVGGIQFVVPVHLRLVVLLPMALATSIVATVFVFLLATKLYTQGLGILLAILTLVPCIGLVVLLIVNGKATAVLKHHGIRVGLLGAYTSDIR